MGSGKPITAQLLRLFPVHELEGMSNAAFLYVSCCGSLQFNKAYGVVHPTFREHLLCAE